jgi:hypothetical protein
LCLNSSQAHASSPICSRAQKAGSPGGPTRFRRMCRAQKLEPSHILAAVSPAAALEATVDCGSCPDSKSCRRRSSRALSSASRASSRLLTAQMIAYVRSSISYARSRVNEKDVDNPGALFYFRDRGTPSPQMRSTRRQTVARPGNQTPGPVTLETLRQWRRPSPFVGGSRLSLPFRDPQVHPSSITSGVLALTSRNDGAQKFILTPTVVKDHRQGAVLE